MLIEPEKCQTCKFGKMTENLDQYLCRRFPDKQILKEADDWCGEFKHKKQEKTFKPLNG